MPWSILCSKDNLVNSVLQLMTASIITMFSVVFGLVVFSKCVVLFLLVLADD